MKTITPSKKLFGPKDTVDSGSFSSQILVVPTGINPSQWGKHFDEKTTHKIARFLKAKKFKFKAKKQIAFDLTSSQSFSVLVLPKRVNTFTALELARENLEALKADKSARILIHLIGISEVQESLMVDGFTSAARTLSYEPPKYRTEKEKKKKETSQENIAVFFKLCHSRFSPLSKVMEASDTSARHTNLVRHLVQRAGNDLTPAVYVAHSTELAKKAGLKTEFLNYETLKKMKAGAFLAVAQGG